MIKVIGRRAFLMLKTKELIFTAKQFMKFTRILRQERGNLYMPIENMETFDRFAINL